MSDPQEEHQHRHQRQHQHGGTAASDDYTEMLDLDATVLAGYWTAVASLLADEAPPARPLRALDVGAGTGSATIALARRLPGAGVTAIDVAELSLAKLRTNAVEAGVGDRVRTVAADLDAGFPQVEPVDLAWASMSLHHMSDPDRVLRDIAAILRPGGFLAVAEFADPLRFLPADVGVGDPGLEERVLAHTNAAHEHFVEQMRSDWSARLAAVGLTPAGVREFRIDLPAPPTADARRYAHLWFERARESVRDRLDEADRAALDALLDPDGQHAILRRDDLHLRGARTVTLARRAAPD